MKKTSLKNRLSYTTPGKMFRGLLCMLTFCVFLAGAGFSIYGVDTYGSSILTNPEMDYRDTVRYQIDISNEMSRILYNLQTVYESNQEDGIVTLIDCTKKKSYDLDLERLDMALESSDIPGNLTSCLQDYRVATNKTESLDVNNYVAARKYLKQNEVQGNYLYLDMDGFKDIFIENGYPNTNHRFSNDFSENAYFVFDFQGSYLKEKLEEKEKKRKGTTVTQIIPDEEDEESISVETIEITNEEAYDEDIAYDISEEQYAVYDPDSNIFYSVWDDFFKPISSYIYQVQEITEYIQNEDKEGTRYDSILIPLLKCYNYSLSDFLTAAVTKFNEADDAKRYLDSCKENGIYYCLSILPSFKKYSNVQEESDFQSMENSCQITKGSDGECDITVGDGGNIIPLEEFWSGDVVPADMLSGYPNKTSFYFAIQPEKSTSNDSYVIKHYKEYPLFAKYALPVCVTAVISLILILVQAVWLISTTGRTKKQDENVTLIWFDRMPTEIWLVFCGVILFASGAIVLNIDFYFSRLSNPGSLYAFGGIAFFLPFAFCFMILTLSFARRIKARNLWKDSLICKLIRRIRKDKKDASELSEKQDLEDSSKSNKIWRVIAGKIEKCRAYFRNLEGTKKLFLLFVLYILLSGVGVAAMFISGKSGGDEILLIVICYIGLQVIAIYKVLAIIKDTDQLIHGVKKITEGNLDYKVELNGRSSLYQELTDGINHISDGLKVAVETSLKDERMKTELITNVSHDLKTPLTSIINYINLLKSQKMPTPEAEHYVEVLDGKAQRLKQLTEDLVEAAKATSGNIELEMMPLTFDELMKQALGEFEDKFASRNLTVIATYPKQPALVLADGRRMFRIIENVLQNTYKYALEGTRIYADLDREEGVITFTLKNVSAAPLNISPDELMERFTRGDSSRTTEGSGLGLSIAKDLTRLQNGTFEIVLDGDLFKVILTFPELVAEKAEKNI